MARFLGRVEGTRAEVTRLGSPTSGLRVEALGWDLGVQVYAEADGADDVFQLYLCHGSNGRGSKQLLGHVRRVEGEPTFTPAAAPKSDEPSPYWREGYEAGKVVGSWVVDGNTSMGYASTLLLGIEEGDPEVMDLQPASLSGEWADAPTSQTLADEWGLDDDDTLQDALNEYEDGFGAGYWEEVERSARAILS